MVVDIFIIIIHTLAEFKIFGETYQGVWYPFPHKLYDIIVASIDKIAPISRNTCPILAFSGFPEIPGSSASFIYGRLANHWMGSYPKIHPPGLDSDFQAYKNSSIDNIALMPQYLPDFGV